VRLPLVGLTGGLGAGKSTALDIFARLGAAVLSSDEVVHELYETDAVRAALRGRWGEIVFIVGTVDRAAVARLVFADDSERGWLEALLWPLVGERVEQFAAGLEGRVPRPRAGVVETPLLFEAGRERYFDATVAIVADDELRASRLALRGQASLAERERRQLTQAEKADRATYVVVNDGTLAQLEAELRSVLAKVSV
jgi:dephospho-CoA kinase